MHVVRTGHLAGCVNEMERERKRVMCAARRGNGNDRRLAFAMVRDEWNRLAIDFTVLAFIGIVWMSSRRLTSLWRFVTMLCMHNYCIVRNVCSYECQLVRSNCVQFVARQVLSYLNAYEYVYYIELEWIICGMWCRVVYVSILGESQQQIFFVGSDYMRRNNRNFNAYFFGRDISTYNTLTYIRYIASL